MSKLTAEERAKVSEAMKIVGRLGGEVGGLSKSKAKVRAARENGKKGGRPRKKKLETQTKFR